MAGSDEHENEARTPRRDTQRAYEPESIGSAKFEYDLAGPFFDQVFRKLQRVKTTPLNPETLDAIEQLPGVYVLYLDEQPVYVGKADDSVEVRLRKHYRTLGGCRNIDLGQVRFKCLYIESTWSPLNYEKHVMDELGTRRMPGWNQHGFGSNEPGVNRGKTRLKATHFYRRFPIKDDWRCEGIECGRRLAFALLEEVKNNVPFWFKFQGYRIAKDAEEGDIEIQKLARQELKSTTIDVPNDNMLARDLLRLVASKLPGEWQATITPSHMLLYKEVGGVYPYMDVLWP